MESTQLQQILSCNVDLAEPALKLLDLYLCLWETYVLKSAENIRLEDGRRQMSESNEWLEEEIHTLLQCCNRQALELEGQKQALKDSHGRAIMALQIIDPTYSFHAVS